MERSGVVVNDCLVGFLLKVGDGSQLSRSVFDELGWEPSSADWTRVATHICSAAAAWGENQWRTLSLLLVPVFAANSSAAGRGDLLDFAFSQLAASGIASDSAFECLTEGVVSNDPGVGGDHVLRWIMGLLLKFGFDSVPAVKLITALVSWLGSAAARRVVELITGHSRFLAVFFSTNEPSAEPLVQLLRALTLAYPRSCVEPSLLSVLAVGYNASGSPGDVAIRDMLRVYDQRGLNLGLVGWCWSNRVLEFLSLAYRDSSTRLLAQPGAIPATRTNSRRISIRVFSRHPTDPKNAMSTS